VTFGHWARGRGTDYLSLAALLLVLAVLPTVLGDFNLHLAVNILAYGVAVAGLDLMVGRAGLLCFGQAVFLALGSYASVVLMTHYVHNWVLGSLIAILAAAVLGALVAFPAARLTGLSFAFVTFALGAVCDALLNGSLAEKIVGGNNGLFPPAPHVFGLNLQHDRVLYAVSALAVAVASFLYVNTVRSPTGRAIETMRESELVARALGVPVNRYRIGVFASGAALAAVGGVLLAQSTRYVSPGSYSVDTSITLVAMLILGGTRSLLGPYLGAAFFVLLPHVLSGVEKNSAIVFSAILLVTLIVAPEGIVGLVRRLAEAVGSRRHRSRTERGSVRALEERPS
jgi:branched-chain amino acid transport system permease protein